MRYLALVVLAACGASPASPPPPAPAPASASTIDPITGQPREAKVMAFASGPAEHLCNANEDVVFACTLEGAPPQAVVSLCLKKGSSRQDPEVMGRERVDGKVTEPQGGKPSHTMLTALEGNGVAFNFEVEQRTDAGAFGIEKQTDPGAPSKPPRYQRNATTGKEGQPGTQSLHSACDPKLPITDNLAAMRAYKL